MKLLLFVALICGTAYAADLQIQEKWKRLKK